MIKTQMFIGSALIVGVAIGYFAGDHGRVAEAPKADSGYVAKKSIEDKGDAASLKALRSRIAELEKALAEKGANSEAAISNAVTEAVKNVPQNNGPRGNHREWLENLKKTDPDRYTQMTNRFAQWRRSRAELARSKMDFLSSIDISHMSASARKTHDELQEMIVRREEIETQLHQEGLSDEERGTLMKQMWETHHEMDKLNRTERRNLIEETARNLGFEGDDVKEISATIKDIIDATDNGFGRGPGGHRRHGGLGGPNGR